MHKPLVVAARAFLYLMVPVFLGIGVAGFASPAWVAAQFGLSPLEPKGVGELRALFGGGMTSWGLITLAALRYTSVSSGLLLALGIIMGCLAVARLVSVALDHETALAIPAAIGEVLIAASCWIAHRGRARSAD